MKCPKGGLNKKSDNINAFTEGGREHLQNSQISQKKITSVCALCLVGLIISVIRYCLKICKFS